MKITFNSWRSTIQSISTNRTTTSHLKSLNTNKDHDICRWKSRLETGKMWRCLSG